MNTETPDGLLHLIIRARSADELAPRGARVDSIDCVPAVRVALRVAFRIESERLDGLPPVCMTV